jgi:hypothetical protein
MRLGVWLVGRLTSQGSAPPSSNSLSVAAAEENHTANYRGCARWKEAKEAKAALVPKTPIAHKKLSGAPTRTTKLAEPSAEQVSRFWLEPRCPGRPCY